MATKEKGLAKQEAPQILRIPDSKELREAVQANFKEVFEANFKRIAPAVACVQCHRPIELGKAACNFCWTCAVLQACAPAIAGIIFGILYLIGVI